MQYESRSSMPGWYRQGRRCFHARRGAGRMDDSILKTYKKAKKWIVNLDFTDFTFFDSDSWISRLFKGVVPFCRVYERTVYTILYLRIPFCVTVHHDLPFAKDIAAKGSFKVSAGPFESNDHRGYFPPGDLWCQVSKRSLDSEAAGIFLRVHLLLVDDRHFFCG